jgi:hypothetical protein
VLEVDFSLKLLGIPSKNTSQEKSQSTAVRYIFSKFSSTSSELYKYVPQITNIFSIFANSDTFEIHQSKLVKV